MGFPHRHRSDLPPPALPVHFLYHQPEMKTDFWDSVAVAVQFGRATACQNPK
jgi:hypothetical protein